MKITKILLLMLAVVLALTLIACNGDKNDSTEAPDNGGAAEDTSAPAGNDTDSGENDTESTTAQTNDPAESETETLECAHTAAAPDAADHCNVKCSKCGELLEENKHGDTAPDSECIDACTVCGDRTGSKAKHTKGTADPEDHCNIKCINCGKVLASNRHGDVEINSQCQRACVVCGDQVEEGYVHETPADDAWAFDASKPQSESAACPRCGQAVYRDASVTPGGLTLFGPETLAACLHNARLETSVETDESGLKYVRFTVAQDGEGTVTLNDGTTALMGVGEYVAMLVRKTAQSGGTDFWINSAGKVDHSGAKTITLNILAGGEWQLVIYDFTGQPQISKENGIGWTRFDPFNPPSSVGETMDVAYIGFFDSKDEVAQYYGAYIKAYLGADYCAHVVDNVWKVRDDGKIAMTCTACESDVNVMDCTHFDLSKLTNISAKAEANTVYFTADCAICGATGADVPSLTQEQGKIFAAAELNAIAMIQASMGWENNASYVRYSSEYVTDEGDMPFTRFVSKVDYENCLLLNKGDAAVLGVNKYVAVLYRKTGDGSLFEFFVTPAGENTPGNHTNKKTFTVNDGTWQLAIVDFSDSAKVDTENGAGWMRIDVNDGDAKTGDVMDIAYIGFFSSPEMAYEHYLAYLEQYIGKENCCHKFASDWVAAEETGKMKNTCTICGEIVVENCSHVSDGNWAKAENEGEIKSTCTICSLEFAVACEHQEKSLNSDSFFTYSYVCALCGYTETKEGMNSLEGLKIFSPEEIVAVADSYGGKYSNTAKGAYSYAVVTGDGAFAYVHHEVTAATTGELYQCFNLASNGIIAETGPYFAVLARRSAGARNLIENFISSNDALAGDNRAIATFETAGEWELLIFDYSANKVWKYSAGAGIIRFDIFNDPGIGVGEYVDIAYAGFFSSREAALAFNAAFIAE